MLLEALNAQADEESLFALIAEGLEQWGYIVLPKGLPRHLIDCLQTLHQRERERFYAAGVGRGSGQSQNQMLRRDKISWIEETDTFAEPWIAWTTSLQRYLNRSLYLGLFSFESHLAVYEPGDFYKTHLDAFRGQSNRRLSLVTYLNDEWSEEQGGELVIYRPGADECLTKVKPELGTLVLFLSEEFPHEVLPAKSQRLSVAGWFRINGSSTTLVDPPS